MALPEPSFITRDPAAITLEMIAMYEAATGKTVQPAQIERLLIDLMAYRENLLRIAIQEASKQNLVEYAIFPMLDYLGELVGVVRLAAQPASCTMRLFLSAVQTFDVAVPAGTRIETKNGLYIFETEFNTTITAGQAYGDITAVCQVAGSAGNGYVAGDVSNMVDVVAYVNSAANTDTTTGGSDEETDYAMRARIKLAPERFSNAGSYGAYRYHALSAHQDIVDVAIASPSAGVVNVYPLTKYGNPDSIMLDVVEAALTDEKVRPLTDQVVVLSPTKKDFSITASITLYDWADTTTVQAAVNTALEAYAATQRTYMGHDIVRAQIIAAINGVYGVYNTTLTAPAADVVNAANEWGNCTAITVNVTGYNNG